MVSRSIKATPPNFIARGFKNLVRANTIAEPLPESAKFELEIAARLNALGWRILYHNVSIVGVQVDLLARAPRSGVLRIIEVKSPSPMMRLSPRQKRRLFRASVALAEIEPVELVLITLWRREVLVLPVDGLTE